MCRAEPVRAIQISHADQEASYLGKKPYYFTIKAISETGAHASGGGEVDSFAQSL